MRRICLRFTPLPTTTTLPQLVHSGAVWLCPCVRQIAGLQTRSVFGSLDDGPSAARCRGRAAGSRKSILCWGFSANLRPAGRDGTFWSSEWWLCGRRPRLLEVVKNLDRPSSHFGREGRWGGRVVQPWLSGSRQVRDSGPAYSKFFSPHSTKCGAGGQFWGGDWLARGLVQRGGAVQGRV